MDKIRSDPEQQEVFRKRMEDQCLRIEHYRQAVLRAEGRCLSLDVAGLEWVDRHAEAFAGSANACPLAGHQE
jgi:transposase